MLTFILVKPGCIVCGLLELVSVREGAFCLSEFDDILVTAQCCAEGGMPRQAVRLSVCL